MPSFFRWLFRRPRPQPALPPEPLDQPLPQPVPTSLPVIVDAAANPSTQVATIINLLSTVKDDSEETDQHVLDVQATLKDFDERTSDVLGQIIQALRSGNQYQRLATGFQDELRQLRLAFFEKQPDLVPPPIIEDRGNVAYHFDPTQQCEIRITNLFNPLYIIRVFLPRGADTERGPYVRVEPLSETTLPSGVIVQRVSVHIHKETLPTALFELLIATWREYWPLIWLIYYEEDKTEQRRLYSFAYRGGGATSFKRPGDPDNFGNPMAPDRQNEYIFYFDTASQVKTNAEQNRV